MSFSVVAKSLMVTQASVSAFTPDTGAQPVLSAMPLSSENFSVYTAPGLLLFK